MTEKDEVPNQRCGFELISDGDDFHEVLSQPVGKAHFTKGAMELWHEKGNAACCWRETWQDTKRCIWHARVEGKPAEELKDARANGPEQLDGAFLAGVNDISADNNISFRGCQLRAAVFSDTRFPFAHFHDANLAYADFQNANLFSAKFHDAKLYDTEFHDAFLYNIEFHDAKLRGAEFRDANLQGAELPDADLISTDFTDANTIETNFTRATLRNALFTRADCRGTTFTSALLYETVFADARIDSQTTFSDSTTSRPTVVYEENPHMSKDLLEDIRPLEAAEWVYRRLEKLHEENALSEDARYFHISKQEAQRKYQFESEEYARYLVSTFQWYVTGHGESIPRIFGSAAVLILTCGILYPFAGGFESSSTGAAYRIHLPPTEFSRAAILDGIATFLQGIYFSVITFTTIGYGDLYPTGAGSKLLVGFESLSGAILIALFVFVLGRRVAR